MVTALDGHEMAKQGPGRHRARHRGDRLVLRRHGRDARHRGDRRAADQARAAVRAGGVLRPDGVRPRARHRARARLGAEGRHHGRARAAARDRRHRSRDRPGPAHARASPSCPTASISRCSRWACSASPRSCATSRTRNRATSCEAADRPAAAVAATDLRRSFGADRARRPASARCSASCRATAPCSRRSPPTRWKRSWPKDPSRFGKGAIEGVAGPESRQQCRRADRVHSAAHARHPAQRGDGADGRRDDHPRHHSRARR